MPPCSTYCPRSGTKAFGSVWLSVTWGICKDRQWEEQGREEMLGAKTLALNLHIFLLKESFCVTRRSRADFVGQVSFVTGRAAPAPM